jgi:hypothetical protein
MTEIGSAFGMRMTGLTTRRSVSLVPVPAGIKPTEPVSTSPMKVSDAATRRLQAIETSAPPPSTIPNGAATIGLWK